MNEEWLPVVGFEGMYSISDQGRVRSEKRLIVRKDGRATTISERILKPSPKRDGGTHLVVTLYNTAHNLRRVADVGHLVLESFVGDRPPGLDCCHANDIGTDNRLTNLRWDTRSANLNDLVRNGRHADANKSHCKSGHRFDAENTRIARDGSRVCRQCQTKWQQEHKDRRQRKAAA